MRWPSAVESGRIGGTDLGGCSVVIRLWTRDPDPDNIVYMRGLICTPIGRLGIHFIYRTNKASQLRFTPTRNATQRYLSSKMATIAKYPEGTPFETGMLEVSQSPPHTI